MASDPDIPPLTFKEKLHARQLEAKLMKPVSPPIRTVGRVTDDDLLTLYALLDGDDITDWERGFCNSVARYLKGSGNPKLSEKQARVLDKLDKEHLEPADTKADPTPQGNPPMQIAKPSKDTRTRSNSGFDDIDDDIPF